MAQTPLVSFASGTLAFFGTRHRYYLKNKGALLKLQVRRQLMDEFLTTKYGMQLLQIVDILPQGRGWYEVTSKDFSHFDIFQAAGGKRDGLPLFIRHFNLWIQPPVVVSMEAANDNTAVKATPQRVATRKGHQICLTRPPVNQDRLNALASRFSRAH